MIRSHSLASVVNALFRFFNACTDDRMSVFFSIEIGCRSVVGTFFHIL